MKITKPSVNSAKTLYRIVMYVVPEYWMPHSVLHVFPTITFTILVSSARVVTKLLLTAPSAWITLPAPSASNASLTCSLQTMAILASLAISLLLLALNVKFHLL